ncbi:MAG: hypothetical protein SFW67_09040 [Myxococcaceae bacterium]|nr:hypothetical protein [Myxococcaceae bacterium]
MTGRGALVVLLALSGCVLDPRFLGDPVIFSNRAERRSIDCTRLSQLEAFERYPGQVPAPQARTVASEDPGVLTCASRYFAIDERPARDEAILSTLSEQVGALADQAGALYGREAVWHVDAFYPSLPVAQKIAIAARTTLAERGLTVSNRVPTLAAGDVAVLATLPPAEVYPAACRRSFETRVLEGRDVFFGVMIVDAKETILHGGVCSEGTWRWLP